MSGVAEDSNVQSIADADGAEPRPFRHTAVSRAGWNIADQALSSLTNAALSILVARSVDANSFGAFAICFSVYTLVIGVTRELVSEPLTIRFSAASAESFAAVRRSAIAGAAGLGAGVGTVLVLAAFTQRDELRNALLALALTIPGLTLQDALRLSFISEGRPRAAAANDFLWAVLQAGGVALLLFSDVSSSALFVAVWGAAAAVAACYGLVRARAFPAFRGALRWLREQLHLSGFFVTEFMAVAGAFQIAMLLVAAIGEVSDVGSLRGAYVLLGPLNVLFYGITFFAMPEIVRRRSLPARTHVRSSLAISGFLLVSTLTWGGLLLQLPDSVGRELLGDAWTGGREVVTAMTVALAGVAASIGPACVLKAFGAARETLRLSLVLAPLLLAAAVIGVSVDGARGAAVGLAVAQWLPVTLWWVRMVRVVAIETQARTEPEAQPA